MQIIEQVFWLLGLSIVVASVSWTVTQEEIFREFREFAADRSKTSASLLERKFFYVFTCEYCFSHWVTLFFLLITGFQFLIDDIRGLLLSFFAVPWIANQFMSLYRRLRVEIKHENALAENAKSEAAE